MVEILNLYTTIPNTAKKLFEHKVGTMQFKKGDYALMDGDVQDKLFLVKSGMFMMYYEKDEKRKVVDFSYRNRFSVDINSFSNQTKAVFCIECLENSTVEFIAHDDLLSLFEESKEIERAYRILTEKILGSVISRHLDLSCLSIEERFAKIVGKKDELFKLVPHKYIASYLNIDPTNFSKLLRNFGKNPIKFY